MKLNIELFGGRGASSSKIIMTEALKENMRLLNINSNLKQRVPTFTGNKNLDKALANGYRFYRGDDMSRAGGSNYIEVANRLKAEGYKVRVFEDTTRVRGLHNYSILYKRK